MTNPFDDTPPTVAEAVGVLRDSLEADETQDWRLLDEARIAELEARIPRWIPVGEQSPETGGYYLVTEAYLGEVVVDLVRFDTVKHGWLSAGEVSHWMPLPELPK